jgi:signal transduction histidine kinase
VSAENGLSGIISPQEPASAGPALTLRQCSMLCVYLEEKLDHERGATARALHDELGGLLVAAKMDLGHLQAGLKGHDPALGDWLSRAQRSLDAVVATERRLVEELQPGLLTHIGLFAALRWYVGHLNTGRTDHHFETDLPADELALAMPQRVALYRATQEALELTVSRPVRVTATVQAAGLTLMVSPIRSMARERDEDVRLVAIRHRVAKAGGELRLPEVEHGLGVAIRMQLTG